MTLAKSMNAYYVYRSLDFEGADWEYMGTVYAPDEVRAILDGREKAGFDATDRGVWEARLA